MLLQSTVFFINTILLLLGSSGILIAVLLYMREKNHLVLMYILAVSAWALNQLILLIFYYSNEIIRYRNPLFSTSINDLSYIFLGLFLILVTFLLYRFFNTSVSTYRWIFHIVISIVVSIPNSFPGYKIAELSTISSIHEVFKVILLYGSFYYLIYFQWSCSKSIVYKYFRRELHSAIILQLIFFPLLLAEGAGYFNGRYPFVINISAVFFFSMNFLWLWFASRYLHLPKLRILDDTPAVERLKNIYGLSNREVEITKSILEGYSYKEIADRLFISYETVKTHVNNIYRKCRVKGKMELVQLTKKCER